MPRPANANFNQPDRLIGNVSTLNTFWTNFDRRHPEVVEVLSYNPEDDKYWWFQTNIEPESFDIFWDDRQKRRFLYQMYDIYYGRQGK